MDLQVVLKREPKTSSRCCEVLVERLEVKIPAVKTFRGLQEKMQPGTWKQQTFAGVVLVQFTESCRSRQFDDFLSFHFLDVETGILQLEL